MSQQDGRSLVFNTDSENNSCDTEGFYLPSGYLENFVKIPKNRKSIEITPTPDSVHTVYVSKVQT